MTVVPFHISMPGGVVISGRADLDAIPEPEELAPDSHQGMVKVVAWMVQEWDLAAGDGLPVPIDFQSIGALKPAVLRVISSHLIAAHATYMRGPST